MDYIADQINQVMIEFGYSFVSSKVLQKEGGSEADYSLYAADTDTGIEVYTDQSGSVLMRVAVLGDDPQITAHDQDFSYQRQLDFCASHMDLVEALAEKGILLRQKNYYAPDKKHTAKVAVGKNIVSNAAVRRRVEDRRGRRRGKRAKMRSL